MGKNRNRLTATKHIRRPARGSESRRRGSLCVSSPREPVTASQRCRRRRCRPVQSGDLPGKHVTYPEITRHPKTYLTCPECTWLTWKYLAYPEVLDLPGIISSYPEVLDLPGIISTYPEILGLPGKRYRAQ